MSRSSLEIHLELVEESSAATNSCAINMAASRTRARGKRAGAVSGKSSERSSPRNVAKSLPQEPDFNLAISLTQTRAFRSKVNIAPPQSLKRFYPGNADSNYWFAYEAGEVYYPVILTDKEGKFVPLPKDCGLEVRMTIATAGHGPDAEPAEIKTISTKGVFWFKAIKAYIFGTIKLTFDVVANSKDYLKLMQIPNPLEYEIDVSVDEHGNKAPDPALLSSLNQGQYYDYVYDDASSSSDSDIDNNDGITLILEDDVADAEQKNRARLQRKTKSKRSRHGPRSAIADDDQDSPAAVSDISGDAGDTIANHNHNSSSSSSSSKALSKQQKLTKYEDGTTYDADYLWGPRRSYGNTRSRKLTDDADDGDEGR